MQARREASSAMIASGATIGNPTTMQNSAVDQTLIVQ
jgi:hypothetical protein